MHDDVIHYPSLSSPSINRFSIFKDVGGGGGYSRVGWDDNNKTESHHYSFSALKNELLKTAINLS